MNKYKNYFIIGCVLLFVLISSILYSLIFSRGTYAINTLDSSYYECPEGTTIFDTDSSDNNNWVCYVESGVTGVCPIEEQTKNNGGTLGDVNGTCSLVQNNALTTLFDEVKNTEMESFYNLNAYYKGNDYVSVYTYSSSNDSINDAYECNSRNYVNTPEDDDSYYGYYNSACVCYGSSNNNNFCHVTKTNWLDATNNVGGIYRYYIPTQEEMACEKGEPIVIGSDPDKGDLYACSLQSATLKKKNVTLKFSFDDNGYTKSDMKEEFEVLNGGAESISIENIGISDINDAGYEIDDSKTSCVDTNEVIYNGSINGDSFIVSGSNLDNSSRFLDDITCNVVFKKKSYYVKVTISDESTGSGSITSSDKSPDSDQKFYVTHNNDIVVDVDSDDNSKYISTTCTADVTTSGSDGIINSASLTFGNVTQDIECKVTINKKSEYKVTASVKEGLGNVQPNDKTYYEGDKPSISAIPSTGYVIDNDRTVCNNGSGNYSIVGNNINITKGLTSDVNCDVYFKAVDYSVVVTANPTGGASDINIIYNNDSSDTIPNYGDKANVKVIPNEGYEYVSNTCGDNNTSIDATNNNDGSYSFEFDVTGNKSCEVKFKLVSYTISASLVDESLGGDVSVSDSDVSYGESSSINATVPSGYEYDADKTICEGNATINKNTLPISISDVKSDVNCKVAFKLANYKLSVTPNNESYGSVVVDKTTVTINDTANVVITPNEGYEYVSNTCGVEAVLNDDKYSFSLSGITKDTSCQVIFEPTKYKITASVNNNGGGTVSVFADSVSLNGESYISATPTSGYIYDADNTVCEGNATIDKSSNIISIKNVSSNVNCVVAFKLDKFSLTVSIDPSDDIASGVIDKSTNEEVTKDESIDVFVKPNSGYEYEGNTCGDDGSEVNASIGSDGRWKFTVTGLTSDRVCTVSFMKIFKVSATAVGGNIDGLTGSFDNADGTVSVYENKDATITISPFDNYVYDSNDCGAIANGDKTKLTLANVNEDKVCNVTFKQKEKYNVTVSSSNTDYGTVSPSSQDVYAGDDATIIVDVTDGNEFLNITCNGVVENAILNGNELIIPNVVENKVCVVNYKDVLEYTVTASSSNTDYGVVSPDSQTVSRGDSAEIILSPNEGYEYLSNDCGASLVDSNRLVLDNITSNRNCIIDFKERVKHNISANVDDENSGSAIVSNEVVYDGEDATIIVVPNNGYEYISNDCDAVYSNGVLLLNNVTSDKVCNIKLNSNVISEVTEDISNVQTGNKEWIILILCIVGVVVGMFSYKKLSRS